jgi:FkbM family methyltransferase
MKRQYKNLFATLWLSVKNSIGQDRGSFGAREQKWQNASKKLAKLEEIKTLIGPRNARIVVSREGIFVEIEHNELQDPMVMILDSTDMRSASFFEVTEGPYEKYESIIIQELSQHSKVFLDVGANIGFYSILTAMLNPELTVYSFEPNTYVYKSLVTNIQLNNLNGRIWPVETALGLGKSEPVQLYVPNLTGSAGASLHDLHPEEGSSDIQVVQMSSLDLIFDGNKPNIELMKIDVEGYEYFVLEGGLNSIERNKPTIVIELLRKWMAPFGRHPQDVMNLLFSRGYTSFAIGSESLSEVNLIDESTLETNFIFVHKDNSKHLSILKKFIFGIS